MRSFAATASTALLAIILTHCVWTPAALAQRVQFPSPSASAPPLVPANPNFGAPSFGAPSFGTPSFNAPAFGGSGFGNVPQGGAVLGGTIQPSFDPYAMPGNPGGSGFGSQNVPFVPPGSLPPGTLPPGVVPPGFTAPPPPNFNSRGNANVAPNLPPLSNDPYGRPTTPNNTNDPFYRSSPNFGGQNGGNAAGGGAFGQGGAFGGGWGNNWKGGFGQSNDPAYSNGASGALAAGPPYQRLFQDTGLRGTYLFGRDKDDLSLTEAEVSTTAFFANFLGVPSGLRVTPGFVFHWTDGPSAPETSDVPARLYSTYLDFGLNPQFTPRLSAELTARVGVYSDFQEFNSDSIRLLGTGVGVWQVAPDIAVKFGGAYIDRVRVKFLPAAGILWTPNPQTRWDIFFPAPKLSNYWTTVGNQQVWWYLAGEYGGGSWTIEREDTPPNDDRIDINDIRVYAGIEWWDSTRYYGFAELGYVFDREVVFYKAPGDSLHVDHTFMVRAGISW